jgi:D-serine deaminase-like pyridoxal phosphate-dependent protein
MPLWRDCSVDYRYSSAMTIDAHAPSPLAHLNTPAAIIDVARMEVNIDRMQARMTGLGVRFRPHVKTSKCLEVARLQVQAGAAGITVSTLKEAEQFFAAGFTDIFYAVGMAPHKLPQAAALIAAGCGLRILVDNVVAARAVAAYADADRGGVEFDVFIEVDTDGHRSGVVPEAAELIEIAQALTASARVRLLGVMTHAGASYDFCDAADLQRIAEQERALCVRAAMRLRAAGFACPEVSVGSTPTALSALALDGVTEVRAGVYVFFDLVMANVGVCGMNEIAMSVLTTVIGHQREKNWLIVDAGWMAMSRDRGTLKQRVDYGYGQVCDVDARPIEGCVMASANQEHGIVQCNGAASNQSLESRFPVGTQLRIFPNHACATAAQFPAYEALHADGTVTSWPRFYGW